MSWWKNRIPIGGDGAGKFIATASHYPSGCEVAAIRPKPPPKRLERRPFVSSWPDSTERFELTAEFLAFSVVVNHVTFHAALSSHFPDGRATLPGPPQPFLPVRLGFPIWPPQLAASPHLS